MNLQIEYYQLGIIGKRKFKYYIMLNTAIYFLGREGGKRDSQITCIASAQSLTPGHKGIVMCFKFFFLFFLKIEIEVSSLEF
jgi:hypothetical protein